MSKIKIQNKLTILHNVWYKPEKDYKLPSNIFISFNITNYLSQNKSNTYISFVF